MKKLIGCNRRDFLKASSAAALGTAFGVWSFRARAELRPARLSFGYLTDPVLGKADEPDSDSRLHPGWVFNEARALAQDLVAEMAQSAPPPKMVFVNGNIFRDVPLQGRQAAFDTWATESPLPLTATGNGGGYFAREEEGLLFLALDSTAPESPSAPSSLCDRDQQLAWLSETLSQRQAAPAVLLLDPPLLDTNAGAGLANSDRLALTEIVKKSPQVILILSGKVLANRAEFLPDANCLCLVTASPVIYPCGARSLEIEVAAGGLVTVRSRFVQTRRLDLVEKSFYQGHRARAMLRLGRREDRSFSAQADSHQVKPNQYPLASLPGPWPQRNDNLTLAVVSDTHVCLEKFVSEKAAEENQLIGHFNEVGSRKIFEDVFAQVSAGRHRVEFFDEVFLKDPTAAQNYLDLPVDALFVCGDLIEHGRREEAEIFKAGLASLPAALRERALLAIGNHDLSNREFASEGIVSSRQLIGEFFNGYGLFSRQTNYAVELADWLSLIVLDTVIPSQAGMGMIQDQLDWLEDQVASRKDKVVLVASHHEQYPLSLVPPAMYAFLRSRSHFSAPKSVVRTQLHRLYARSPQVKMLITGHYHGAVVDQFRKDRAAGNAPDDAFTTHMQVPCTVEYPCGYRLFKISREDNRGRIEYISAYTRLADLRRESSQATLFRVLGGQVKPPRRYEEIKKRLAGRENFFSDLAFLNPYDFVDLNVRGFKDGTGNRGRGNTGKPNINGRIEFTI